MAGICIARGKRALNGVCDRARKRANQMNAKHINAVRKEINGDENRYRFETRLVSLDPTARLQRARFAASSQLGKLQNPSCQFPYTSHERCAR